MIRSCTFFKEHQCLNQIFKNHSTMKKILKYLNDYYNTHDNYNFDFERMRKFVKTSRRLIHIFDFHIRDFNATLMKTIKRKKRANLKNYRIFTNDVIEKKKCKFMYSKKIEKIKKIEERKIAKKIKMKQIKLKQQKKIELHRRALKKNFDEIIRTENMNTNIE